MSLKITSSIMFILHFITFTATFNTLQCVLAADKDSCEISRSTVQIVDDCPITAEKWEIAAARKNCTAYADQCDEPKRLVYHCVINTDVNQTIEVCAYAQNIGFGECTEYNDRGNLIQSNSRAKCSSLPPNPCPLMYKSNEAFKYSGCYKLTKKADSTKNRPNTTAKDIFPATQSSDLPRKKNEESASPGKSFNVFFIILLLISVRVGMKVVVS